MTQVIGNGFPLQLSIFQPGVTLASQLANQYSSSVSPLFTSSLLYLALILLVITFAANLTAQRIVHRFERAAELVTEVACRSRRPGALGAGCALSRAVEVR